MSLRGIQCPSYNEDSSLSMSFMQVHIQRESSVETTKHLGLDLLPNSRKKDPPINWVKLDTIYSVTHASKNLLFLCIWGWKIWIQLYFNCYMKLWSLFFLFILSSTWIYLCFLCCSLAFSGLIFFLFCTDRSLPFRKQETFPAVPSWV